jgi:signal transduction histidine kinase
MWAGVSLGRQDPRCRQRPPVLFRHKTMLYWAVRTTTHKTRQRFMYGSGHFGISVRIVARLLMVVICLCIAVGADPAKAENPVRRVLILYPFDQRLPSINIVGEVVTKRFLASSLPKIDVFSDYLDLSRFEGQDYRAQAAAFLAQKYHGKQLDLVVALGPPALDFIREYRSQIAPGAKIVFGLVSDPNLGSAPTGDIAGVRSEYDLKKTLELAARLQPDARQLVVVTGTSDFDRSWEAKAREVLAPFAGWYETTYLSSLSVDEMLRAVSVLQSDAIVLVLTVYRDKTGRSFIPLEVGQQIAERAGAPSYTPYDTGIGRGLVGGYTETFEAVGVALADLALDMLAGKSKAPEDKRNPTLAYRVDARQLKRWRLSEANLPPGTHILFDEKSVWEQYGNLIIAIIAVIVLQSGLLTALIIQGARRRRTEAALRASESQAETQRREIAHMSRVLVLGELTGAIAHELNQPLTAILANAEAALMMLDRESPDVDEALAALAEIVEADNRAGKVIQRLRGLLKKDEVRWELIDVNDIVKSTQNLVNGELINRAIRTKVELAELLRPVSGDPIQLQQVTLNLMINAMDALASVDPSKRQITVSTRVVEDGNVEVAVSDNGSGIAPADESRLFQPFFTTKPHGLGLGLSICSKILISHGGKLSLVTRKEGGACASFILPPAEQLTAAP